MKWYDYVVIIVCAVFAFRLLISCLETKWFDEDQP